MKVLTRFISLIILVTVLFSSCSRKKSTFTRRAYHNTTSHYNYYFNARELLRAYIDGVEAAYVDDYNYLLPIFIYGNDDQSNAAYNDMDEIIKKCSKLIDRHAIYLKNEEFNRWVDQSYLLVGKARFHKQEYYGAIEIFEYMVIVFKGKPSYYEAKMWMARCYMAMEDYRETYDILDEIKVSDVPDDLKGEYYALWADYSIKSGEREEAAPYLREAVENTSKLKLRRRYTYILAQLYHERHDYANATKYYGKVLKMRPDYRMSFNARLNQARSYDVSANNSKSIKKRLGRMLRDKKNLEFRDQIYFALAELAFREEDEPLGMEYLRKSAQSSVNNNKVKAEAYMLLGDIFYDKPKYILSHAYYDSCMVVLPNGHPKYERTKDRKESLDDLVESLLSIKREDSLQRLASMDEKERDKMINKIIRDVEREEELQKQRMARSFALSSRAASSSSVNGGSWYFYNQNTKSFGISEFEKYWGRRPYEDNWRRSVRETKVEFSQGEEEVINQDSLENVITNKDPEFYLKSLPLSDSSLEASNWQIILALYSAGNIFREDFMDYKNSIECFERLVNDYDTSHYVESCYYQLYRIYLILDEQGSANKYRDIILNDYPFSEYARIIKNPEYLKNKRDKNEQIEAYYKATYQLYQYNLYRDVIEACIKSDTLFGKHHMNASFSYLKALSIGKSQDKEQFKTALEDVIAKYPSSDVAPVAQKILDKMNSIQEEKVIREDLYKKNFRAEHVFVVMVPNLSTAVEEVKVMLSDYNIAEYGAGKLNVGSVLFNGEQQMISVKSFKDKDEGMKYLNTLSKNPDYESSVSSKKFETFLISMENYAYFYQKKDVGEYLSFYGDHYVNK